MPPQPAQHGNASPAYNSDRSTKLTRTVPSGGGPRAVVTDSWQDLSRQLAESISMGIVRRR